MSFTNDEQITQWLASLGADFEKIKQRVDRQSDVERLHGQGLHPKRVFVGDARTNQTEEG